MRDKGPRLLKVSLFPGLEASHRVLKGPRLGSCDWHKLWWGKNTVKSRDEEGLPSSPLRQLAKLT